MGHTYDFPNGLIVRMVNGTEYRYPTADAVRYSETRIRVKRNGTVLSLFEKKNMVGVEDIEVAEQRRNSNV